MKKKKRFKTIETEKRKSRKKILKKKCHKEKPIRKSEKKQFSKKSLKRKSSFLRKKDPEKGTSIKKHLYLKTGKNIFEEKGL